MSRGKSTRGPLPMHGGCPSQSGLWHVGDASISTGSQNVAHLLFFRGKHVTGNSWLVLERRREACFLLDCMSASLKYLRTASDGDDGLGWRAQLDVHNHLVVIISEVLSTYVSIRCA